MRIIEQFFRMIAPSECLGCSDEGSLLCRWCVDDKLPVLESRCYRCNSLTSDFRSCVHCRRKGALSRVWQRTEYADTSKELVHRMKFKFSREAAEIIARELAELLPALPADTIIVHVPTITSHMRQRGLDHAKLIAVEVSRLTGYKHYPALVRIGQHRQIGSRRQQRIVGIQGSFRISKVFPVKDLSVLLVDDVVTTGATLEEAAKTLKAAGTKTVNAIVFARAR